MSTTSSMVPTPGNSQAEDMGFDPQTDFAQVLEEARKNIQQVSLESEGYDSTFLRELKTFQRADLAAGISCCPAHFKAADLQKPREDLERRRSWKNSLAFWKKSRKKQKAPCSDIPTAQHPGFKSRAKPTSGPIYSSIDIHIPPPCRSNRSKSGCISGRELHAAKDGVEIPYVLLSHHKYSGVRLGKPIYLVT